MARRGVLAEEPDRPAEGRSITERYALATLIALVTLVSLSLISILALSFRYAEPNDARISAIVGLVGPAVGGLLIMLQNAQVRSAIQGYRSDIEAAVHRVSTSAPADQIEVERRAAARTAEVERQASAVQAEVERRDDRFQADVERQTRKKED